MGSDYRHRLDFLRRTDRWRWSIRHVSRSRCWSLCLALLAVVGVACAPVAEASPPSSEPTVPTEPLSGPYSIPSPDGVGVPPTWNPRLEVADDITVHAAGTVIEDVRVHGSVYIEAPNVTLRRVEIIDGMIYNHYQGSCQNGLLIEDSSILHSSAAAGEFGHGAILHGGYTARNVLLDGVSEGFRVGGRSLGCDPVLIEDSYVRVVPPDPCGDWHGDALQGYDGVALTIIDSVLVFENDETCLGTAPFFYPSDQGNTSVFVDGLLVAGGGYPFRLGMPGTVTNLQIVDRSWGYGPSLVRCSLVDTWRAWIVRLSSDGTPVRLRPHQCTTEDS